MIDRKEVLAVFKAAAPEIHHISREAGFWADEEHRNKEEMLMLIIAKLGDALEAHRTQRVFPASIAGRPLWSKEKATQCLDDYEGEEFSALYEALCKSTIGDEIANAGIILLDFFHGFKLPIVPLYSRSDDKETTKNFGQDLYRMMWRIGKARYYDTGLSIDKSEWASVIALFIALCDWWNIDIISHMRWNMKYNATRPYLHGKSY